MGIHSSSYAVGSICSHPELIVTNVNGALPISFEDIETRTAQYAHLHCSACGLNCYGKRGYRTHLFYGREPWKIWQPRCAYEQEPKIY
jgi:hypothetical protein